VSARRVAGWLALRAALLLVAAAFGLPFLWMVASALDAGPPRAVPWPRAATLDTFRALLDDPGTRDALRTSLVVAVASMLLATATAALAGYGLSRMTFRRKTWLAYGVLLLQTIPLAVTMVPIYDLAVRLELQNTWRGLILSHAAVSLPLLVWLMKGFTDAVPRVLEEEAWVDGAGRLRAWWDVVVPAMLPGIAVVAGLAFAAAWAEVIMVVVLVTDARMATLPFRFYLLADAGSDIHQTAALGTLYVLPVLALFLALRQLMVRGLAASVEGL
jgi:ABC-type glycerol-3-phosphate transport system permease component